ncbi:hypothetical protein M0R72_19575 [Candidatus Pacearchaeota archaeon]|jgi:hypothetical protein|nr:hypothetical protein [Candidatus Pacearchaeota archaeon]
MTDSPINLAEISRTLTSWKEADSLDLSGHPVEALEQFEQMHDELVASRERIAELEVEKSIEKLVYDPTIPRYSSKESVIIPQAEDADSLSFMLEYLCDDPNDNRDFQIEIAKDVLHRYLTAIDGGKQ